MTADEDDEDAAFADRWRRWEARYRDRCVSAPVPMWWPWPLERVVIDDGDPDTGLIVVGLEPFLWPGESSADAGHPDAKLVRQRAGEAPYSFGWPGLAWMTPEEIQHDAGDDPPAPVFAHTWQADRWQWTIFTSGSRRLTGAEVARIREKLDPDHQLPQGAAEYRPW